MSLPPMHSQLSQQDRSIGLEWLVLGWLVLGWLMLGGVVGVASFALSPAAYAVEVTRAWQATPARPYVTRGADRRLLERAEQFAASGQWDDASGAIHRLLGTQHASVVAIGVNRYVSVREYCHRLLTTFPKATLTKYRRLVDARCKSWYEQGITGRDEQWLQRIVDKNFCSSWGDDALLSLGELALERGDYQVARNAWLRISSKLNANEDRLTYPDTDLSLAMLQARLILTSLREGDWGRAESELKQLRESDPRAVGRLGGREVVLAQHLTSLLKLARKWPAESKLVDWPTFAATSQRTNAYVATASEPGYEPIWSAPLANSQLSVFPIVINDLVIYQDGAGVHARHLAGGDEAFTLTGETFRSPEKMPHELLGQPWLTLTATKDRLFGTATTLLGPRRKSPSTNAPGSCWGIDLQREGALVFQRTSEDPGVAFAGAPLVVENRLWVPCRSNDPTARAGVVCYDLDADRPLWQRWLCRANTPATGWGNEVVSNLLTYDAGVIYVGTNLGAIAALRAHDGHVLWLRTYERQSAEFSEDRQCAYYRGPCPCVYYRGTVFALPADGKALLALDAATGAKLWQHPVRDPNALLLGVSEQRVSLADQQRLQFLDLETGAVLGDTPANKWSCAVVVKDFLITTSPKQLSVLRKQSGVEVATEVVSNSTNESSE